MWTHKTKDELVLNSLHDLYITCFIIFNSVYTVFTCKMCKCNVLVFSRIHKYEYKFVT